MKPIYITKCYHQKHKPKNEVVAPCFKKSRCRVIVSLYSNAFETHNPPHMLIGKSTKSVAFNNTNMRYFPVYYRSLKTACLTKNYSKKWFHSQFVPSVSKYLL